MNKMGCRAACACVLLCLAAGTAFAQPAWVETGKGALNARKKANSKSDIVMKIPNGSEVELLEEGDEWSQIRYGDKEGYVLSGFLTLEAPVVEVLPVVQEGGYARIATQSGSLNLRSKADPKSAVIGQVSNGARVEVVEATQEWSSVVSGSKQGYVRTEYLVLDSQLIGKKIYPDDAYLYVRQQMDASSRSIAVVSAAQPMTIVSLEDEWVRVSCEDASAGAQEGYVRMKDISLWREAPSEDAKAPVDFRLEASSENLALGQVLDMTLSCKESAEASIRITRDGKTVLKEKKLESRVFSYRPREAGTYLMEIVVSEPDGGVMGQEFRFTVQAVGDIPMYTAVFSQKDGWWLDKKYSRSNLDQSGCALFTLSHALRELGIDSEKSEPAVLGKDYAAYLAESGTVTSNMLAAASKNFGFKTEPDKIYDQQRIEQLFGEGAVFSFAIVNGHIALAAGMSEDGTKVRVLDSAPSATMERIKDASIYLPGENGSWQAVNSLWDVPGARFYPETEQFSGMEYYLDLGYVAGRGVRMIAPK